MGVGATSAGHRTEVAPLGVDRSAGQPWVAAFPLRASARAGRHGREAAMELLARESVKLDQDEEPELLASRLLQNGIRSRSRRSNSASPPRRL